MSVRADLHIHTTASDGTWTPAELIAEAQKQQLGLIAVTDHDSVANVAEAMTLAAAAGITLLPAAQHCAHMLPAAFTVPDWSACSISCGRRNSTALNATTPTIRKKERSACSSIAKSTACLSAAAATAMVHLCRGDVWDSLWSLPICCAWTAFCRKT